MSEEIEGWNIVEKAFGDDNESLAEFKVFFKKYPAFDLNYLFEQVDETDYSLPDWIEALYGFEHWMEKEGVSNRPFKLMLGYIHCCTQINPPAVSLASLKVIVCESLIEYGFDDKDASQL